MEAPKSHPNTTKIMEQISALLLTLIIEAPLVTFMSGSPYLHWRFLFIACIPTLITHPILWLLASKTPALLSYFWWILLLESLVVAAEAYILWHIVHRSFWRCFMISLVANLASALVGILSWRFL